MNIVIQPERPSDADTIREVTAEAFQTQPYACGREPQIIDGLRKAGALSVSLVAWKNGRVVGHVAASPVEIAGVSDGWYGIGPVSVLPEFQRQGIGSLLMRAALQQLQDGGAKGCVLVGAPEYYQRFGFHHEPSLSVPGVPAEVTLCVRFTPVTASGVVKFHPAFGMANAGEETDQPLVSDRFPRSSKYHPDWIKASVSGGANSLWLTEWLASALELRPGMRVLDLGCGRAASAIFLHREFGVQVWATDLWFSAAENLQRIQEAGSGEGVFPIHADARALPFATEFFDAVVSIDSFVYYGTDDLYLEYLARFVKPSGTIAIAGAGLMQEIEGAVPDHLREWWEPGFWCLHTAPWWRRHWERTGILTVELAEAMPDGWKAWLDWQRAICPENHTEIRTVEYDQGRYLGYVRVVGRRRAETPLQDPAISIPPQYTKQPLLRSTP